MSQNLNSAVAVIGIDIGETHSMWSAWMIAAPLCCARSGRVGRSKHGWPICRARRHPTQAVVLWGVQVDKLIRIRGGLRASPGLRPVSQIGTDEGMMQ